MLQTYKQRLFPNVELLEEDFESCTVCEVAKARSKTCGLSEVEYTRPGEMVSCDVGQFDQETGYFLLVVDHYSGYLFTRYMSNRSYVPKCVREFLDFSQAHGVKVERMRTDGAREFVGQEMTTGQTWRYQGDECSVPVTAERQGGEKHPDCEERHRGGDGVRCSSASVAIRHGALREHEKQLLGQAWRDACHAIRGRGASAAKERTIRLHGHCARQERGATW